jgi:hypothetical protein
MSIRSSLYSAIQDTNDGVVRFVDNLVQFVDPSSPTKAVRIDAGSVTAGQTRVITAPDYDVSIGTGVGVKKSIVSQEAAVFATPTVLTAADSGKEYLLNVLTGAQFTLPIITASVVGSYYDFFVALAPTSNSYKVTGGQATDLMYGAVLVFDKDTATGDANALVSLFRPDLSNDNILTLASADATTGNLVGGSFRVQAESLLRWKVTGVLIGDGSLATIFA